MTRTLPAALLAATVLAAPAAAATLAVDVDTSIGIVGSGSASNDVFFGFEVFGVGDGTGFDGDPTDLDFTLSDFATGPLPFGADFAVTSPADLLRAGVLVDSAVESDAVDDGDDVIELLFGGLSGSAEGAFGELVLVTLLGEFGADPFASDFGPEDIRFTINPATITPVPLPAGAWLLLTGFGALGLQRMRRRAA